MKSVTRTRRFAPRLAAIFLSATTAFGIAPATSWGREPIDESFPSAVPLLDRGDFELLADQALSNPAENLMELQNLKVQRFQELKHKIEDLSRLLEQQRAESTGTVSIPSSPHPSADSASKGAHSGSTGPSSPGTTHPAPSPSSETGAPGKSDVPTDGSASAHHPSGQESGLGAGQNHGQVMSPQPLPQGLNSEQGGAPNLVQPPAWQDRLSSTRSSTTEEALRHLPVIINSDKVEELNGSEEEQGVVSGQIDRFSLACSLFGAGETEACLKVLGQTDVKGLSREDQLFVQYMQACCHRRGGRLDQAREIYRRIVVAPEADWMKDVSSWWLDNLDSKSVIGGDIGRLQATLSAWETELANVRTN